MVGLRKEQKALWSKEVKRQTQPIIYPLILKAVWAESKGGARVAKKKKKKKNRTTQSYQIKKKKTEGKNVVLVTIKPGLNTSNNILNGKNTKNWPCQVSKRTVKD